MEYVAMPDGSSSAAPVINPGPRFEKNLRKRPCRTNARLATLASESFWLNSPPAGPANAGASPYSNGKVDAGMNGIAKKIAPIHVVHIDAIGVKPTHRPRVSRGEPIAAVLKASRSAGEIGAVHVKRVALAKIGAETVVGYLAMACRRLRSVS